MKMYALRGATTLEKDTEKEVEAKALELIKELLDANNLCLSDIVSLTATHTVDITSAYAVKYVRESGTMSDIPLFSCTEPDIKGGLKLCLRYMILVQKEGVFTPRHIYLHKAQALRTDLIQK